MLGKVSKGECSTLYRRTGSDYSNRSLDDRSKSDGCGCHEVCFLGGYGVHARSCFGDGDRLRRAFNADSRMLAYQWGLEVGVGVLESTGHACVEVDGGIR